MQNANQSGRPKGGNSALGRLLKARREAAGLTLTQLARELDVSRPYLSRLETGEYGHPSWQVLNRLIKRLDISVEDAYAVTGDALPDELPTFSLYLRAKHGEWPEEAVQQLDNFYEFLKHKYSLE